VNRLFHFVLPDVWRDHVASGAAHFAPPSLAREGFVHLSYAHQLAGTLAVHFRGVDAVLALELTLADRTQLVDEPSRDGALFPHLYRALATAECTRAWHLERGSDAWRGLAELVAAGDPLRRGNRS
jgi:uncharacterized protein (DUF952 family)